jgi:serine/threonine protein kinase
MWHVNPEELNFSYPVEVIGQGAFGVVLAAEYRGTRVAIKRVVPQQENTRNKGGSVVGVSGRSAGTKTTHDPDSDENTDPEIGTDPLLASEVAIKRVVPQQENTRNKGESVVSVNGRSGSEENTDPEIGTDPLLASEANSDSKESSEDADPLGGLPQGPRRTTLLGRWLPSVFRDDLARSNLNLLGTASGSASTKSLYATLFPKCDETSRRQQEFLVEMRLLSRLRHPCKSQPFLHQLHPFLDSFLLGKITKGITTIMGAVMTGVEPMMVMEYMENGSL